MAEEVEKRNEEEEEEKQETRHWQICCCHCQKVMNTLMTMINSII